MPKVKKNSTSGIAAAANVGYEAELWQMAEALRGSMDADELHATVVTERAHRADHQDADEYCGAAPHVFSVSPEACWPYLDTAVATSLLAPRSGSQGGKELGYGK